ncbi:hypothetical protein ACJH6J_02505 [Mycobacterium sp. SMC-18]
MAEVRPATGSAGKPAPCCAGVHAGFGTAIVLDPLNAAIAASANR